ncbi:MAG: ORF6N domain-containing protein [Bacilli bacterium]|nr:ORF6N domain-containing protein [Bacilli bacterium]
MNDIIKDKELKIEDMIYEIRGKQVMLDSDLARLYECTNGTKDINKAVNRNINRFPTDFYFQLTREEYENLKFQFGTSSLSNHGGVRKLPYVFTEQGVAMLATVLRTKVASQMSISIMRAFVTIRKFISTNLIEQKYINSLVLENHSLIKQNSKDIELLQESFQKLESKRKVSEIYFNGQIYDAYSKIQEIFQGATKSLIIIDSYADNTILDIIKRLKVLVVVITKENNLLTKQDISKYDKQYHNLKVVFNNSFHDRYFIIDNSIIYHCGASVNRIGYKTFSINLISDKEVSNLLISNVNKVINY